MKIHSSYDKLEKTLNEPARDYNTIKELVETQDNSITNIKNIKNNDIRKKDITTMIPKQKKHKK